MFSKIEKTRKNSKGVFDIEKRIGKIGNGNGEK